MTRKLTNYEQETIIRENEKINQIRDELKQRSRELEASMKSAKQEEASMGDIKKACELVSKNFTELSFENKRLALEVLNIKVWVNGENIRIEGAIPIGAIVTTQSLPHLSRAHPHFP